MTTRRTFLLKVVPAAAAVTVLGSKAVAATCAAGQPDWDKAQKNGYVEDASKVTKKIKNDANQTCTNCIFLNADKTCKQFVKCGTVADKGWCKLWAKNPKVK